LNLRRQTTPAHVPIQSRGTRRNNSYPHALHDNGPAIDPVAIVLRKECSAVLEKRIQQLDWIDRTIVTALRGGKTQAEIAGQLHVREITVRRHKKTLLVHLRQQMKALSPMG
jgi:DNA-directed RNA polymerase specialized sigma subunit